MTYEEIVRRVNTKSSICPECGCFISSLLDCCPACGWDERSSYISNSQVESMVDIYKAIGGNHIATLYANDKPFLTEYVPDVDYTSYYKAKTDALQAQQHVTQLYEEAIKAMKSYSGNKVMVDIIEEEIEYVKGHCL